MGTLPRGTPYPTVDCGDATTWVETGPEVPGMSLSFPTQDGEKGRGRVLVWNAHISHHHDFWENPLTDFPKRLSAQPQCSSQHSY